MKQSTAISKFDKNEVIKARWLTPKITSMMNKIRKENWFVRELIYPKEVPGCEIFDYNGCMRLYHRKDRFFAFDGERLNTEAGKYCNLNVDFFSAEKIIIQQRDNEVFDHWQNASFELTSLWPERQLVIAANHDNKQLIAFAPVFVMCTPEFHATNDIGKFYDFEKEFNLYCEMSEKKLGKSNVPETLVFLKNSYNLLIWLKNHCY